MKTNSVSPVSFNGGLKFTMISSEPVAEAVKKSPAIKRLGTFYKAQVYDVFLDGSNKHKDISYLGLVIDDIKPRNIFVHLFDFVTGRKGRMCASLQFNSLRQTDGEFIEVLQKMKKNTFTRMIAREKA